MRSPKAWDEDLLSLRKIKGKFNRAEALKVKRELHRMVYL